jgi:hypothetical protein
VIAEVGAVSRSAAVASARRRPEPLFLPSKPELDKAGIPLFGLVAEEVAKVNPDLVTHNAKGDIYTVRCEAVNAMLLNEFLKEHHKVEEQERKIKVSAQLEVSEPAPKTISQR